MVNQDSYSGVRTSSLRTTSKSASATSSTTATATAATNSTTTTKSTTTSGSKFKKFFKKCKQFYAELKEIFDPEDIPPPPNTRDRQKIREWKEKYLHRLPRRTGKPKWQRELDYYIKEINNKYYYD